MTIIAMWAHPRSVSTAFTRMMMQRGDLTVVHEPLVTLTDFGEVTLPAPAPAEKTVARRPAEVFAALRAAAAERPVFVKDTLEYRYDHLFEHPDDLRDLTHTFIVREPERTINSHRALKPDVSLGNIGYEHQWELFKHAWRVTGARPVVVTAERLLADPAGTVSAYCARVGLSYLPGALSWQPEDRPEFAKTRRWHLDAIASTGFVPAQKRFEVTVANDPLLRSYYEHHLPFYERLVEHAL
ncbi:hypothetical protein ACFFWC_20810 [Plantactinospora siamensis]|uniref:Sulfotransferase family protein n=1 Tax=Plantactinospora siamensis TaxID=555372 RepID=A0ABV6NU11_9ACTN